MFCYFFIRKNISYHRLEDGILSRSCSADGRVQKGASVYGVLLEHSIQHALADYISSNDDYLQLPSFYQKKRDYFIKLIGGSKFILRPCSGSYFQLLNYSNITDDLDTQFAIRMTKEFGVASIPVSVFYHQPIDQKVLRFCFAKTNETLEQAAERLLKVK